MKICVIPGFSPQKGEERLKVLIQKLRVGLPECPIIVADYLNPRTYGKSHFRALISERENSFRDYTERVYSRISDIDSEFVMIGYSIGCVIARILVEKMNLRPRTVILVAAPNRGIKLLRWEKLLKPIIKVRFAEELAGNQLLSDLLTIRPQNYYFIAGLFDKRVPLESAIPGIASYMKEEGREGRAFTVRCSHSQLIPKDAKDIKISAIPVILEILKEIQT